MNDVGGPHSAPDDVAERSARSGSARSTSEGGRACELDSRPTVDEHPHPEWFHPESDVGPDDERCIECGRFHVDGEVPAHVDDMRQALRMAAMWFKQYASTHREKGDLAKAARNQGRALFCLRAAGAVPNVSGSQIVEVGRDRQAIEAEAVATNPSVDLRDAGGQE